MRLLILIGLLFSAPLMAAELVLGVDSNHSDSRYGDYNAIDINTSGQVGYPLGAGENQTLGMREMSLSGTNSAVSSNITQATANNDLCGAEAETIGFFVNTTNSGTIRFYNDADGTCNSNAMGAAITPAAGAWYFYPVPFSTGICALTGGTGIDVTVVYRCSE